MVLFVREIEIITRRTALSLQHALRCFRRNVNIFVLKVVIYSLAFYGASDHSNLQGISPAKLLFYPPA